MYGTKLNILLTSAGRRGYLVEYFKRALNGSGLVHAGNSDSLAPAFYYADRTVTTPLIYNEDYIPFIINYCKKNDISVIIPLFDVDLMVLARNKTKLEEQGIKAVVSSENVIDICNDKWKTYQFCMENQFAVPKTYLSLKAAKSALLAGEVQFPLMIKPRWGMGSIAVYEADTNEELEILYNKVKRDIFAGYLKFESVSDAERCVLLQEKIDAEEYGLDIINDLEGRYQNTIVKRKISMRSGETDCAAVIADDRLEKFGADIGKKLGHTGNLDMDIFVTNDDIYILEMNARFGGGYPFSHMAGVNLPAAIIKWLLEQPLQGELEIKSYNRVYQKDIQLIELSGDEIRGALNEDK